MLNPNLRIGEAEKKVKMPKSKNQIYSRGICFLKMNYSNKVQILFVVIIRNRTLFLYNLENIK